MTDDRSSADPEAAIERRLDSLLQSGTAARIPAVGDAVRRFDDRWYGTLLVDSYDAASDSAGSEPVPAAAAAVELLRGYCRLRSDLLAQCSDVDRPIPDSSSALLTGDWLYATAYAALDSVDHAALGACYGTLTDVSETMVAAFATSYVRSPSSNADQLELIDDTAGALGRAASVIGATLAGLDGPHRERFATLGRGLGTARQVRRTLDSEPGSVRLRPAESDERRLRRHAVRRLAEADRALSDLSSVVAVRRLRRHVREIGADVGIGR